MSVYIFLNFTIKKTSNVFILISTQTITYILLMHIFQERENEREGKGEIRRERRETVVGDEKMNLLTLILPEWSSFLFRAKE